MWESSVLHLISLCVETLGGALSNNKQMFIRREPRVCGNDVKAGVPQGSTLGSLSFVS